MSDRSASTASTAPGVVRRCQNSDVHNLTGFPAVVVRGGSSPEGLPIGVQLVAPPWREDVALAAARIVEAASGGWQPPAL